MPSIRYGIFLPVANEMFPKMAVDNLKEISHSDDTCHRTLLSIIETVPVKHFVNRTVSKLLYACMRLSQRKNEPISSESGNWAKRILVSINKSYPSELVGAFHDFLEDAKVQSKNESSMFEILCRILDGNLDLSLEAEVRCSALSGLTHVAFLKKRLLVQR
ncbi:hypothetical protein Acr_09g0003440 [Actinidia rufa]|uniref:ARM repeat superfamily protein n=1 Tax=Actinidia rufa TaxID=165716 RepID=A0A7J0F5A6_9ERIC|nr:hypothetical protein Acr_09g0003440 [Actinidia rufa]